MKFLLVAFFFSISYAALAQKPPLDTTAIRFWPSLENPKISNDGKYICYTINNHPFKHSTLIIASSDNLWRKEITNAEDYFFSETNKHIVYKRNDTLFIEKLSTSDIKTLPNISTLKAPEKQGRWIAYTIQQSPKQLHIVDLVTDYGIQIDSVSDFNFDEKGKLITLTTTNETKNGSEQKLSLINLDTKKTLSIWDNANQNEIDIKGVVFDHKGEKFCYLLGPKSPTNYYPTEFRIFDIEKKESRKIISKEMLNYKNQFSLGNRVEFSQNGEWLFFDIKTSWVDPYIQENAASVDIWNYKDAIIQPAQSELPPDKTVKAVVNCNNQKQIKIFNDKERIETFPKQVTGDHVVIADKYIFQFRFPYWWQVTPQPSLFLLSLTDDSRLLLQKENYEALQSFQFSPQGRYLIYFDTQKENYFSCDVKSKKIINITTKIKSSLVDINNREFHPNEVARIPGWFSDDKAFMIYDNYDIWKIDPTGLEDPVNLTNGYGDKNKIQLRLISDDDWVDAIHIADNSDLLLVGYGHLSKYNGFFSINTTKHTNPKLLSFEPCTYYITASQVPYGYYLFSRGLRPIKAKNKAAWIVMRQTTSDAPNYFVTNDFISFTRLSNLQPHKGYNWVTNELITWKLPNGTTTQGVLYKPENFDSTKRYPVIFHYYEEFSHALNQFPVPQFTSGDMNIPWFVSQGYLVFTPDFHYFNAGVDSLIGDCAVTTVESAASILSKRQYIDSNKIAIQGHSFGGYETNYIISHSNRFKAAIECAGITDPISGYLTLAPFYPFGTKVETFEAQAAFEIGHSRMGKSLWDSKEKYLKASSVFNADKITTPLLIMHNMNDPQIPWRQSVELYMALRRQGKKVWMLQYDDEGHTLRQEKNKIDFTIRMSQFLNYYLRDSLPPIWMTEGAHAKEKGKKTFWDYDESNPIP